MKPTSALAVRTWALALAAALLPGASAAHAYTLVTRDGHVIESTQKPEVKGAQVFLRLPPHGRLAVVQESQIDWQRTQAANPAPQRQIVPGGSQMVRHDRPAEGNIEKRIVGDGTRRAGAASRDAASAPGQAPAAPGQAAPPAAAQVPQSQQSVHDQEALVALRKQHVEVKTLLTNVRAQMESHEKELAELQSRQSAFVSDDNPVQTRIRELQDEISAERARISQLENRLADIRAEAIQHGGVID